MSKPKCIEFILFLWNQCKKIENPINEGASYEPNINVNISHSRRDWPTRIAWRHHYAGKIQTLAGDFNAISTTVCTKFTQKGIPGLQ